MNLRNWWRRSKKEFWKLPDSKHFFSHNESILRIWDYYDPAQTVRWNFSEEWLTFCGWPISRNRQLMTHSITKTLYHTLRRETRSSGSCWIIIPREKIYIDFKIASLYRIFYKIFLFHLVIGKIFSIKSFRMDLTDEEIREQCKALGIKVIGIITEKLNFCTWYLILNQNFFL